MKTRLVATAAVTVFAAFACQDWSGAEQAYCEKPGTFCFDGGPGDDGGSGEPPDAGIGDAGGTDAGEIDAGSFDGGFTVREAISLSAAMGLIDARAVDAPAEGLFLAGGQYFSTTALVIDQSVVDITGQTDAFVIWMDRTQEAPSSSALVLSSGSDEVVTAVAAQSANEAYAAGIFFSDLTVGSSGASIASVDGGGAGGFLVRMDQDANVIWARTIADYAELRVDPTGMTAFPGGPVLTAEFFGNTTIDGKAYTASGDHSLLGAIDPDGGFRWTAWFECDPAANSDMTLHAIDHGMNGTQIGVAGSITGSCIGRDATTAPTQLAGGIKERAVFMRFNAAGAKSGVFAPGTVVPANSWSRFTSVSMNDTTIALAGEFQVQLKLAGFTSNSTTPAAFFTALDLAHAPQFVTLITSTGEVTEPHVHLTPGGALLVAGTFTGTLSAGGFTAASVGARRNVFILSATATGDIKGLTTFDPDYEDPEDAGQLSSGSTPGGSFLLSGRNASSFTVAGKQIDFADPDYPGSYVLVMDPTP